MVGFDLANLYCVDLRLVGCATFKLDANVAFCIWNNSRKLFHQSLISPASFLKNIEISKDLPVIYKNVKLSFSGPVKCRFGKMQPDTISFARRKRHHRKCIIAIAPTFCLIQGLTSG